MLDFVILGYRCFVLRWRNHFVFSLFLVVDAHFQFIEAKAVNAVDVALGDDGLTVGLLDDAEDVHALVFAAHNQNNLDGSLGVPTRAVEHGATAVGHLNDIVGDFLPLLTDDLELDTLSRVVDDTVGSHRVDHHVNKTIHDFVNRVEQQP